ncbi:uncharacterized protein LOC132744088 isoform X1 [Ruditapes philippinarum]|uniref:uncharacterized protein LOC132744088 isoform X1 n=2 Tax=Ruditapes philippinarum TaxID=129788 RepID=UPI00295B7CA6|nr:uncharacterized protein LOC132744088 isoform X1 [Ruditapes philippinarum]
MGNATSDVPRDQRKEPREEANCLADLPRTFSNLYNNVMSLVEATVAQQEYVEQLYKIAINEAMDDATKFDVLTKGRSILENLQASRFIHTTPVQDSVLNLYHNIQGILRSHHLKQFEIDSPFLQETSKKDWNRHQVMPQHQTIDSRLVDVVANEMHKKEMEKLSKNLSRSQEQIQELKNANLKVCAEVTELRKELKQTISYNKHLQYENERLSDEIEKLKPPTISGTVQLYHSHSGNTIKDIEEELKTMLKNHLKDVQFVKCNRITDIDQSQMLIVLSIIASRVGTDAANAIKDVPRPENTALLLFHIKEIHALTKQASTAVLTDRSFKDLGGIFDLAFVNGKGLYQCEMNENAMKSVCDFIKKGISGTGV